MWPDRLLMRVVARAHDTFRSGPRCLPSNSLYLAFRFYRVLPCALNVPGLTATGPEHSRTHQENDSAGNAENSVMEQGFSTRRNEAGLTKPPSHGGGRGFESPRVHS